jgi:sugar-specific transcriptional regulator TrmB
MDEQVEFEFPDEKEAREAATAEKPVEKEVDVEVIDDTPEKDRGREPSEPPSEVTEDELESYSDKVKKRIQHLSKGYHDERRAKESAAREREEALRFAKQVFEENKRLKGLANESAKTAVESEKYAFEAELSQARAKFKKAYEDGDADLLATAQEEIADAKIKLNRVNSRKVETSLQEEDNTVYSEPVTPQSRPDYKAQEWQRQNQWFGQDEEMTSFALGVHEKLVKQGVDTSSNEYYERLNSRIRQVFPDSFDEEVEKPKKSKPANVVAPATRSTAPKKIVLTQTQVALAKRLGVPLELYAKKVAEEMGKNNG